MALKFSALDLNPTESDERGNKHFKAVPDTNLDSNLRVLPKKPCKRESTRAALISATKELVMERGKEKISIQEITHRAKVGSGTFYNYFESKHRVFEAIAEDMLAEFKIELNELRAPLKDPAMIVAVTLSHCFKRSANHNTWNKFLSAVCLNDKYVLTQDADQCFEDIERGVTAGRFKVENIPFTQNLILAMVRHINREIRLGSLGTETIEDATRAILKMLGISDIIARALTQPARPPIAARKRSDVEHASATTCESDGFLRPISDKSRIIG